MRKRSAPRPGVAIFALSGSSRPGSLNRRLLDIAVEVALAAGAEVSVLDLRDLELPVYDPGVALDITPRGVLAFRQLVAAHDGLLIATPEYNGSVPPLLKNALDWSACPAFGDRRLAPYRGKLATLMSADHAGGGLRCLDHLRTILCRLDVFVFPDELSVPFSAAAFDAEGLSDPACHERLHRQVVQLVGALHLSCNHGGMS